MTEWITVAGTVVTGYGVASGQADGAPEGGTIAAQLPHFAARGLDLSHCYPGTLNVSIAPRRWAMAHPAETFPMVRWSETVPAETFSFSPCRVEFGTHRVEGFVYYPHPETKPDHFHPPTVVEVIAPFIGGLAAGASVRLLLDPRQVRID